MMKDITLIEMIFSNILDITEKSNKSHLAPDLNTRIDFESFNDSRKHPCSINKLKNFDRGKETTTEAIFKKKRICHHVRRISY